MDVTFWQSQHQFVDDTPHLSLGKLLGIVLALLVDLFGEINDIDIVVSGIAVCLGAFAHDLVAVTVAGTDGRDAGPAVEYVFKLVVAVSERYGYGCDESFELGKTGSGKHYNEVISAEVNSKLVLLFERECVDLGAEHLDGASCDIGTEISVDLVDLLDVYESDRVLGSSAICEHLVKPGVEVVRIVHAEFQVVVVKICVLGAETLNCDKTGNAVLEQRHQFFLLDRRLGGNWV